MTLIEVTHPLGDLHVGVAMEWKPSMWTKAARPLKAFHVAALAIYDMTDDIRRSYEYYGT